MRIQFSAPGCISLEEILSNARRSASLGLPHVIGKGRLAVVGGGPSTIQHLDELRQWPGEIWGINGAASWLCNQGIENVTFCTLHPGVQGVSPKLKRCVLGDECSPEMFDYLIRDRREILLMTDILPNGTRVPRGPSTVTGIAIAMVPTQHWPSFDDMTFFGCECSYAETTHLYDVYDDPKHAWIVVRANGETFRTKTEFLMQAQVLSELIHKYPTYQERSGGLLAALVQDHEYEILDAAPWLLELIEDEHGNSTRNIDS